MLCFLMEVTFVRFRSVGVVGSHMNFRVTLADDSGNEEDVVVWRVEFKDIGDYQVQLEGVGPLSYPSWAKKDEFDDEYSFLSKGPSLFMSESYPVRIVSVEPTTDDLTQPSFDS